MLSLDYCCLFKNLRPGQVVFEVFSGCWKLEAMTMVLRLGVFALVSKWTPTTPLPHNLIVAVAIPGVLHVQVTFLTRLVP